jgi:hypothetical protein
MVGTMLGNGGQNGRKFVDINQTELTRDMPKNNDDIMMIPGIWIDD